MIGNPVFWKMVFIPKVPPGSLNEIYQNYHIIFVHTCSCNYIRFMLLFCCGLVCINLAYMPPGNFTGTVANIWGCLLLCFVVVMLSVLCGFLWCIHSYYSKSQHWHSCNHTCPGLILGLHPTNERRRYIVTTSLIGWAQALLPIHHVYVSWDILCIITYSSTTSVSCHQGVVPWQIQGCPIKYANHQETLVKFSHWLKWM